MIDDCVHYQPHTHFKVQTSHIPDNPTQLNPEKDMKGQFWQLKCLFFYFKVILGKSSEILIFVSKNKYRIIYATKASAPRKTVT